MNQKQIFTEYWKVLNDFEDFSKDKFRIERLEVPEFKIEMKKVIPSSPLQCKACDLHKHGPLRSPLIGDGQRRILIINRALPASLIEKKEHFTPEEENSVSKWLEAIGLDLNNDCTILPFVFCAVKNPQAPDEDALQNCFAFIDRQIDETNPEVILILGREGARFFEDRTGSVTEYKKKPVFVSYHPSDVLIDLSLKRPVWEVLKNIKDVIVGA